jgi:hypothetical protein
MEQPQSAMKTGPDPPWGVGDTGDTDRRVFFSGGGMVQLDTRLAQFAGVISGFDLGDRVDLQSLEFGSSSSAMSWMQRTFGGEGLASADGGGHIVTVALLGQYAANFSAGADGYRGIMITDAMASSSVPPTLLVAPHS